MRLLPALLAVGLGAIALAGFGGDARYLGDVRVCGTSGFDKSKAACRTDQRAGITSGTIYCSARTQAHAGDTFSGRLSYRGTPFPVQKGTISRDGNVYTYLTIGGAAFPGGRWRCDMSVGGDRASVAFTTKGRSGPVTGVASCLTRNTVPAGPVRACKSHAASLPATSAITCSAVYSLARGKRARAEVLYEGKPTGLRLTRKVPLAISVFGVQVSKPGGLPAGRYSCVFSLGGKKMATTSFEIVR